VCKARHRVTGLLRAVKTVTAGERETPIPDEWERMLSEVEALMELNHPNIVRLYEYYRDDTRLFLVEEYCSGGTLEQRLESAGGRFEADEAAVILRQMLRGLVCCHANGLLHRDIKPDNFVYGSADDLKMIDFGLTILPAALAEMDAEYVQAAGTLEYTAPETLPVRDADGRLIRDASYSQAADMWSIGAILFLLVTGEPLVDLDRLRSSTAEFNRMMKAVVGGVERDLLDETATKIRNEKFIASRLRVARRRATPAACELLEKLLVLDPMKRATATQALKDRFVTDSYLARPLLSNAGVAHELEMLLPKMRRFADAPALRRLAVLVEAHLLGPQDDEAINKGVLTFRATDQVGLGALTAADIAAVLSKEQLEVPDDLGEICRSIDIGNDGSIDLLEFIAATMDPQVFCEPRLCQTTFQLLDADGDGWITVKDIEKMLGDSPNKEETARAILAEVTAAPPHGKVDFVRFCEVMLPPDTEPSLAAKIAEYMSKSFV
jgi:calcium-dependent protein kinase